MEVIDGNRLDEIRDGPQSATSNTLVGDRANDRQHHRQRRSSNTGNHVLPRLTYG